MKYNMHKMIKKYTRYTLLIAVLCLASMASLRPIRASAQIPGSTSAGNHTDASKCVDGTAIPSTSTGGTEASFCSKGHGGYLNDVGYCNDGTKIPSTDVVSGNETRFCSSRGGQVGDPGYCTDGAKIPTNDRTSGTEARFCSSPHPGAAPGAGSAPPAATPSPSMTPPGTGGQTSGTNIAAPDDPTRPHACGQLTTKAPDIQCIKECDIKGAGDCPPVNPGCSSTTYSVNSGCGIVQRYINPLIRFLSAGFGIIVAIMIAVGGLQYATAGGDPQKVAAGKKRIFNAIFALIAFGLLATFLNFIIPGGLGA